MSDTTPPSPPPPDKPPEQPSAAVSHSAAKTPQPSKGELLDRNLLQPMKVYTHSPILYWWPIWLLGFVFYFLQATGIVGELTNQKVLGLIFVFTLAFVIFSTTVRLRGANSVIFGLILVIGFILLTFANLSGPIADFLAQLDIRMSNMFYLVTAVLIFVQWALMIFGFDKVRYWEIVPGQLHERVFWGSGDRAESGANARCRYRSDDFLRHRILGLVVTGDIEVTLGDGEVWHMHNVLFAKQRTRRMNELIVTRPVD
ncbi:hypothetical protein D1227_16145 [Henriciella mobilis]|uniref:hypothetical protein n=1 Tax=Henriciella mobilis TaxID=2305467 RepID=UPI000E66B800|nr:hypothetical protein [Henriciella mobilis]RIJ14254.1 hypothetical protein D1231_15890 [Henriciella mobilis]RIJ19915.1 hypothetical protein D1227_16145 [Henriciella mobilis]